MSEQRERLVAVTALPAGWRAVYAFDSGRDIDGALSDLPNHDLFSIMPVAALASVDVWESPYGDQEPCGAWDENVEQVIRPLVANEGVSLDWWSSEQPVALLGPGEELEPWIREGAILEIKNQRARRAPQRQQVAA